MIQLYSIGGAIGGILGALLISFNYKAGWYVWLVSNLCWIVAGIKMENWPLVIQFGIFFVICLNGIKQWEN
jgi:hypothetical protein